MADVPRGLYHWRRQATPAEINSKTLSTPMASRTAKLVVALLFALLSRPVAAQTCLCVEADPGATCSSVVEDSSSQSGCSVSDGSCTGCVCDLTGTMTCAIERRSVFAIGAGDVCGSVEVDVAVCPEEQETSSPTPSPSPTNAPGIGTQRTSCTVSGRASTRYACEVDCFDASLGDLASVTVAYELRYDGFFNITNTNTAEATDVSISQNGEFEVAASEDDFLFFFEEFDIALSPNYNGLTIPSGQSVFDDTTGSNSDETVFSATSDEAQYMLCSTNNDPDNSVTIATLNVLGLLNTVAPATLSTASQGTMSATLNFLYTYNI